MKFTFEKLGSIRAGEVELGDLTILCGYNNTGKTYVMHAIYSLLRRWKSFTEFNELDLESLHSKGYIELDLEEIFLQKKDEIIRAAERRFTENLHTMLAIPKGKLAETKIKLDFECNLQRKFSGKIFSPSRTEILSFEKESDSLFLKISINNEEPRSQSALVDLITRALQDLCFKEMDKQVFIASSERTGALTFRAELNLQRNSIIQFIEEGGSLGAFNPKEFREKIAASYALPIRDNIDFLNALEQIANQQSPLVEKDESIIKEFYEILGGSVEIQSNVIYFVPKAQPHLRLTMNESSGAVHSLVHLQFYLKYLAKPGDYLMIDEPELNLHPEIQAKLARFFGTLVNAGIKIIITTHSDFIAREINTLVMLSQNPETLEEFEPSWAYKKEHLLNPEQVKYYITSNDTQENLDADWKTIEEIKFDPDLGFSVSTFNDTIEKLNDSQTTVYYNASIKEPRQ